MDGITELFGRASRAIYGHVPVANNLVVAILKSRIARLRRLGGAALEMLERVSRDRILHTGVLDDLEGIRIRRRIAHGRSRSNHGRIVRDWPVNVGDGERDRSTSGSCESSALDRGEVLAHAVEFRNRRPRIHERTGGQHLVGKRQPIGRRGHQSRRATRQQHEQSALRATLFGKRQGSAPRRFARGIWRRMRGVEPLERRRQRGRSDARTCNQSGNISS